MSFRREETNSTLQALVVWDTQVIQSFPVTAWCVWLMEAANSSHNLLLPFSRCPTAGCIQGGHLALHTTKETQVERSIVVRCDTRDTRFLGAGAGASAGQSSTCAGLELIGGCAGREGWCSQCGWVPGCVVMWFVCSPSMGPAKRGPT